MVINRWKSLWNPPMFQGWGKKRNYFEGWYFKMVNQDGSRALGIIPGISLVSETDQHAFIQILDGTNCRSEYLKFPIDAFWASDKGFEIRISDHYFSAKEIRLSGDVISGHIRFDQMFKWPQNGIAPGIMGWYGFVPFMECYHDVISMDHKLSGNISYAGKQINFDGGNGYLEKDWGRSFPNSWIWMQSNHFGLNQVSVMVSVAKIPWLNSDFTGFISGLLIEGKLYTLATYNNSRLDIVEIGDDSIFVRIKSKFGELSVRAVKGEGGDLIAPSENGMTGKVNESMQGKLEVEYRENGKILFAGTGRNAGVEIGGNFEELKT